jgi:O-methyltransferase
MPEMTMHEAGSIESIQLRGRHELASAYLDLLKMSLTNTAHRRAELVEVRPSTWLRTRVARWIRSAGFVLAREHANAADARARGLDNNPNADTMIGLRRLDNIQRCVERALEDRVAGDLIEAGVWRGGAAAFMRAILRAHDVRDRTVWVADSFAGLPPPDEARYPEDRGDTHHQHEWLAIPLDEVQETFRKYGLLDQQVRFLEGWFKDTLPAAPIERLAVIRLDGDMYESTMEALEALYPRLAVGGFIILDDWDLIPSCRRAVDDFRGRYGIAEPVQPVDGNAGFWRRER